MPRRTRVPVGRRAAATLGLTVLLLTVLSGSAPYAAAQGSGITVINVPPQFSSIDIRTLNGLNYVDVVVSDYNSWSDIYRVQVDVLSNALVPVAQVAFQQYLTNTSAAPAPQFNQSVGDYFVEDLSSENHSNQSVTIPDRTEMHLTFVLSAVKGEWVNVSAMDRGGLIAYAQVQYAAGLFGGLPLVAEWIVVLVAVTVAVVVVGRRIRRDHDER